MITQEFIVDRRYWKVYVYYDVTSKDTTRIITKLHEIGLPKSYIASAYTILNSNKLNQGFTQTNNRYKTSVIVFTKTSNASQFVNSFVHEIGHLSNHIAKTYNLNLNGEEIQYIAGDIAQEMFKRCHTLMCDCCKKY
uniref:IrrE N-terminal-like domain-containing protein n=1 Tax=Geladintestivirus 5 TaxID=3233137 RepID=A0AAU8MKC3_9CAUD